MEIWNDIPNYEGFYQASNKGRIRSLDRRVYNKGRKGYMNLKGRIIKQSLNFGKIPILVLSKDGKNRSWAVSALVAMAFLNHKPCRRT